MLSIFPSLLSWTQISPVLIRLCLGAVFIVWAYKAYKDKRAEPREKAIGALEAIAGILLVIGLWTQLAALFAVVDLVIHLVNKIITKAFLTDGVNYYLILLVLAISLMVTGPGFMAFDLPL